MDYICTSCNYVGPRKKVKPGSNVIEVLLWTIFLIPGPFYTLWRVLKKHYACPQCGEKIMVAAINGVPINKDKELSAIKGNKIYNSKVDIERRAEDSIASVSAKIDKGSKSDW